MMATKANLLRTLSVLAAAALAAGLLMLIVVATTRTAGAETGAATRVLSDTWEWDGQAWTNLSTDPLSAPYVLPGLAMADNPAGGTTLLVGTGAASGNFETWEFDGNSNTWRQVVLPADLLRPSPRPSYAMALDRARNVVVLFGGGDAAVGGGCGRYLGMGREGEGLAGKSCHRSGGPDRPCHGL